MYVVKDDDEAVKLANDSHYGLGGAVFSQNIERAKRMASRIETGMVYINWLTDTAAELRSAALSVRASDASYRIWGLRSL